MESLTTNSVGSKTCRGFASGFCILHSSVSIAARAMSAQGCLTVVNEGDVIRAISMSFIPATKTSFGEDFPAFSTNFNTFAATASLEQTIASGHLLLNAFTKASLLPASRKYSSTLTPLHPSAALFSPSNRFQTLADHFVRITNRMRLAPFSITWRPSFQPTSTLSTPT